MHIYIYIHTHLYMRVYAYTENLHVCMYIYIYICTVYTQVSRCSLSLASLPSCPPLEDRIGSDTVDGQNPALP